MMQKRVKALRKEGWKIIYLWECGLKPVKVEKSLASLLKKFS
jgi:G:T-mismatch repair DNA endonuclease (very short patch repair protein)